MSVNVNRSVTDQFYRYKMPSILAKVEGKGNGIKTVIVNMPDIAKALYRPPMYPTKYFGCELGAQTQHDNKNERYIVNGSHDAGKLQELLDGFIKKFVLCENCDNPETNLKVYAKKGVVTSTCTACGHQAHLDPRHRLTTFIIKNPPEDNAGTAGSSKKKPQHSPDEDGDNTLQNGRSSASDGDQAADEDDDWGDCEFSEEAVRERMKNNLSSAARNMAISSDLDKSASERMNMVHEFVTKRKNELADGKPIEYRAIVNEAERLEVRDKAVLVVAEVLLDDNIISQAKLHRNVFLVFCNDNQKAQKYLLGALEQIIGVEYREKLLSRTANVLKAFYDLDILDEEVLIEWGSKVSKKYVSKEVSFELHKNAEKFITWLKEAEEESSEDDDDAVDFSTTGRVGALVIDDKPKAAAAKPTNGTAAQEEEDDDDVDIDDI